MAREVAADEREGPYTPWRTLLPGPDHWLIVPNVGLLIGVGSASVTTFAQDVLGRHLWALQLGYTQHSTVPNVAAN